MSVFYVTTNPMTLDQAIHLLKEIGCTVDRRDEYYDALVKGPDGNYFHLDERGGPRSVSVELFADPVQPYTFDVGTRVVAACSGSNDPTVMAAALNMVSEFDDEYDEISTSPRGFLWVWRRDGSLTSIHEARLFELYDGEAAETEVEQLLVDNPDWFSTYVNHALGEHCVMISEGAPLPKWSPEWLERWSTPDDNVSPAAEAALPKLASGEIDYPTLKARIAEKYDVKPGGYFIWQGPGKISIETGAEFVEGQPHR